jgi:aldose 1-epimerase
VCELAVRADDTPMTAEIGWHPWFVKPDAVDFAPTAIYPRDHEGIAVGPPVEPPPIRTHPDGGSFDDCFVNTEPVVLQFGDLALTLSSDCDHWVLYDEPEHATCVEPQSGPPDAFNQQPRRLGAGEELRRTFIVSWGPR